MAKLNKCPYCKSAKGYKVYIKQMGYQYENYTFGGKLLNVDRQGTDDIEKHVTCLNCDKSILTENTRYKI